MLNEDESLILVGKGGDATGILLYVPEVGIIQLQQGTDQDLVHHPVRYQDYPTLMLSYYLIDYPDRSFLDVAKTLAIRHFYQLRMLKPFCVEFGVVILYFLMAYSLPPTIVKVREAGGNLDGEIVVAGDRFSRPPGTA